MKALGSFGGYVCAAGLLSSILTLIGYELRILFWIDAWGASAGWLIRGGMVLGGAAFWLLGQRAAPEEEEPASDVPPAGTT